MKRILYGFALVVALFSLGIIGLSSSSLISNIIGVFEIIIGFVTLNTIFVESEVKGGELCRLYKKMLLSFEKNPDFLCHIINRLDVSDREKDKLNTHFQSQKPTESRNVKFYVSENFIDSYAWWFWVRDRNCLNERKDFIKVMISLTSREGI